MNIYKCPTPVFAVIITLLFCSCEHKVDCTTFKTGRYYFYTKKDRIKILVIRNDSVETRMHSISRDSFQLRINWRSDCEYEISRKLPPRPANDTSDIVYAPVVTPVKIIECNRDFFVCEVGTAAPPVFPAKIDTLWVDK